MTRNERKLPVGLIWTSRVRRQQELSTRVCRDGLPRSPHPKGTAVISKR